jgi:imidazolonepropionase
MAQHKIAAVLLPTTQNIEKLPIPPITTMRKENMIVALGTDFCPNAFCYNMNLAAHYACTNYRLTPNEALAACTINAAYALDLHHEVGSIEVGKKADFLLLDCEDWVYIVYGFGDCFAKFVIKNGRVVGAN